MGQLVGHHPMYQKVADLILLGQNGLQFILNLEQLIYTFT